MSHGKFCWNELNTRNLKRVKKFYADTLGWTYEDMPMAGGGTYTIAKMGGENVGGMFDTSDPSYKDVPEAWLPYVAVDDVDARVKKALKAGGKIMKPAFDIPGVGRIAILVEPG